MLKVIITYKDGKEKWDSLFYFKNIEEYNEEIGYYLDDQAIGITIEEE